LVKEDEKEPVPVPSDVFVVKEIVGLVFVDQTIPLAVIGAPLSAVILPPEVAEVVVINEMPVVVIVGIEAVEEVSLRQRME
jgi:hypothetical protein